MQQISQDLFQFSQDLNVVGVHLGAKMTVVRLSDGNLWLHSPIKINSDLKMRLDTLGEVKYVVAPNIFHHLYLGSIIKNYPEARIYGSFALIQKRKDISFYDDLNLSTKPWQKEVLVFPLKGTKAYETLFYHKSSKSLIVTDFLFNLQNPKGIMDHFVLSLIGCHKKVAASRFYKALITDRSLFLTSLEPIKSLDIQQILLPHGEAIVKNVQARLQKVLQSY